ncbi:MAG: hypothetical protein ACP5FK_11750, partial [bacterium]
DEIRQLGLEFGIVTPYTSYLVVEDERELVSLPTSVREFSSDRASHYMSAGISSSEAVGETSVDISSAIEEYSEGEVYEVEYNPIINYINGKSFTKTHNMWIEQGYEDQPVEEIGFASEEFYNLLRKDPEIGDFLSLKNVIFYYRDKWIKITSN